MQFSLLIKPAGPDCNLDCRYCFYRCKYELFGGTKHRMTGEILEKMTADFLALRFDLSSFAWQGGEPAIMGLDFYRQAVELQKKYALSGQAVSNAFQTNAVMLDENWCRFFREYNFLLGISLDGPKEIHDYYRRDYAGCGTYDRVINAIEMCRANRVQFNILVLLNDRNIKEPDTLFDFLVANKFQYWQFIPCVEKDPAGNKIADYAVSGEDYGRFVCRIFERWKTWGPEKISIRLFDSLMNYVISGKTTECTFNRNCNDYIVIEHNADVFCCDFFVDEESRLGNIMQTNIQELFNSTVKKEFSARKKNLCNQCLICRYCSLCMGGCLKDRIVLEKNFSQPSHLCRGYKMIFEKILPQIPEIAYNLLNKNKIGQIGKSER